MEGASAPTVFPTLPLSPFLPSGCVYAVVSLPLSSVSFRCWLISQESRVPLPQPVPSSSFYLAALFSGYVRSAALDAFSKHNELGPAQLSTAKETQHLLLQLPWERVAGVGLQECLLSSFCPLFQGQGLLQGCAQELPRLWSDGANVSLVNTIAVQLPALAFPTL